MSAWFNVLPDATDAQYPAAALAALGVATAAVPLSAPHGLTRASAAAALAALAALPPGPLVVQCATGNRASAVLALHVGARAGWGPEEALSWAHKEGLPFLGTQPLRNWVVRNLRAAREAAAAALPPPAPPPPAAAPPLILRQLFHAASSTFTYLLGDPASGEALLIDPVLECAERDATAARELGLRVGLVLNTHMHADHVSGASRLRGLVPGLRSAIGAASGALADECLADGQEVRFGARHVRALATPGHTAGCMSFVLDDRSAVFTGDALLVRGCGRTDFQGGSAEALFDSVRGRLFALPRATLVYPGHDYNGFTASTIGEEADLNPRLGAGRSREEFGRIMGALGLPRPAHMDVAVPANLRDGILAGAPPGEGIVPPGTCIPCCRQDFEEAPAPMVVEW